MVELTRASIDSMSSREHGRGSARNRAPERAVLAIISSAPDAIVDDATPGPALLQRDAQIRCWISHGACVVADKQMLVQRLSFQC